VSGPQGAAREQWLSARKELLVREKELTRLRDSLAAERRRLPVVRLDKNYVFEGPTGQRGLPELFDGCHQLIIHHFMFAPGWDAGCPSCAAWSGELPPGLMAQLRARDTAFAAVSLAPLLKIMAYRAGKSWEFPWYSSAGSDFNYDFHATLDESVAPVMYNYQSRADLAESGSPDELVTADVPVEVPGISCFVLDGGIVFHTYSTYSRGVEQVSGLQSLLELTASGLRPPHFPADLWRPSA
jgi:predicted dithiol-disulfide oxidoreductase (DUF899 family)